MCGVQDKHRRGSFTSSWSRASHGWASQLRESADTFLYSLEKLNHSRLITILVQDLMPLPPMCDKDHSFNFLIWHSIITAWNARSLVPTTVRRSASPSSFAQLFRELVYLLFYLKVNASKSLENPIYLVIFNKINKNIILIFVLFVPR